MKYAADFREIARDALRGRWGVAILAGFVAALFGAEIFDGGGGHSSSNRQTTIDLSDFFSSALWIQIRPFVIAGLTFLVIWLIVTLALGGAVTLGYARFNLNLVDKKEAELSDLFSQFHRLGAGFCMRFFMGLYLALWTLLFVIPGVIKTYSYAMTPYILQENPDWTADDAITESRRMMDGNKWRLFCLSFSFIGWDLLCSLPLIAAVFFLVHRFYAEPVMLLWLIPLSVPLGIGFLFLRPYRQAAYAAFYRDVSGTAVEEPPALGGGPSAV